MTKDRIPQLFRKPGKNCPLGTRAISKNLVGTIQKAYSVNNNSLEGKIKGHDVRAVAASLSWKFNPSWASLKATFGWQTPSVFISHYCRGESALNKVINSLDK